MSMADVKVIIVFCLSAYLHVNMVAAMFLGTVISGVSVPPIPQSPCPEVFRYQIHSVAGDDSVIIFGLITINTPAVSSALNLMVHLQLQAILPSKYVGLIELVDRPSSSLASAVPTTVYRVLFPLVKPIPYVRFITLNSQVICTGLKVSGPVVTDIRLEHSLRPLREITSSPKPSDELPDANTAHEQLSPYNIDPGGACGRPVEVNPLVVGGRLLRRGEWPWLAAIFVLTPFGLEFHCSGSIVTRHFVLTVGHCMNHEEAGVMKPKDVVIYLGKYNLQQWEEPHSVIKEVSEIHIHPQFDPNKYTADLALVKLKTPAEYNLFIQPVCLWSQKIRLDLIVGHVGTVVGWGKDNLGTKMSPTPRVLEIPIVSNEDCINSHAEFLFLTSSSTLCAGAKNGMGPCNGDSGGGLMLQVTRNNATRWELRGLVSLSLLNSTTNSCDLSQYVVFTDIAKFLPWIASVINP